MWAISDFKLHQSIYISTRSTVFLTTSWCMGGDSYGNETFTVDGRLQLLNSSCLLFLSSFVYGFKVLVVKLTYSSLVVVGLLTDVDIVNYNNV